jgi:hypothetical protein
MCIPNLSVIANEWTGGKLEAAMMPAIAHRPQTRNANLSNELPFRAGGAPWLAAISAGEKFR